MSIYRRRGLCNDGAYMYLLGIGSEFSSYTQLGLIKYQVDTPVYTMIHIHLSSIIIAT